MFNWVQNFIKDIQNGRELEVTVIDALRVLQTIDSAYESARTGKRVEIEYLI